MREIEEAARRAREFRLHPLGFLYLQDGVGAGVIRRVHVWLPDGPDRPENDRHQHSFDIESLVVAGGMRSELFLFRETEEGVAREFAVTYGEGGSILHRTGRRGVLDAVASFETVAGARYKLEAGVIHRVAVMARPCVTLLTTTERGVPIHSYGNADHEAPFVRRQCTDKEAALVAEVLQTVGLEQDACRESI